MIRMNKTTIFGIIIFVIMLSTGIGYAFLSSNLSINGTATVSSKEIICKRATSLHTETCTAEDKSMHYSCGDDGYTLNSSMVNFGKLGVQGNSLQAGDAFDCDVNGDGTYNSTNERFYYVTDLDTDNSYAVLIFYSNISSYTGAVTENTVFTYSGGYDTLTNGPINLRQLLPETDYWSNVHLASTVRNITDDTGKVYVQNFEYKAGSNYRTARLLTFKELTKACPTAQVTKGKTIKGKCEYLAERTHYISAKYSKGYWLEDVYPATALEGTYNKAWVMDGRGRTTYPVYGRGYDDNDSTGQFGLRPAIEVKKGQIDY
ncbi:MAG: hypothetical protein IJF92_01045 [Bacilli bacterium]|nr:hypothetical protein [Bacilli bacterium]